MIAHKRRPVLVPNHHVDDGINAVKLMLPHTVFNATACASGLEALRQYSQEWDSRARVFKKTPRHDWASHGADAARYLAMAWKKVVPAKKLPPRRLFIPIQDMTLDDWISFGPGGVASKGRDERL